jgi:O-glycosyl hydrolase
MPGAFVDFEPLERRVLFASIAVNISQAQQTLAGLGGNYARAKYGDFQVESNDKVGQYTLANLHPQHARVGIPLRGWEPTNDDSDPNHINMAGFATTNSTVNGVFQLMQSLAAKSIPITASVWDAPNWMVSNPTSTQQRIIPQSNYPELIESIAAFLIRADQTFGVKVDYISINEPDGGFNLKFSSTDLDTLIKMSEPMFVSLGLSYQPKWLVGDTGNAQRLVAYATPILSDPAAAPYLGPISFHAWDSLTYPDSTLTAIAALGQQYNKPIWCEEVGFDAGAFSESPAPFPTWSYAIQTAEVYNKVLKLAGASVGDYWEFENDFPLLQTNPTVLYPSYYVVNTDMTSFSPGEQMVTANSDTSTILSMAATNGTTGNLVVQAINSASTDQVVTITGLPVGMTMTLTRSSATENAASIGAFTAADGTITINLPASSVSTFTGIRPAAVAPPSTDPLVPLAPLPSDPLPLTEPPASDPISLDSPQPSDPPAAISSSPASDNRLHKTLTHHHRQHRRPIPRIKLRKSESHSSKSRR